MRRRELKFLLQLAKLPKGSLKDLLPFLNDDAINAIGVTLFNLLYTTAGLKLSDYKKGRLRKLGRKNEKIIKDLTNHNNDVSLRRALLHKKQTGGFLSAILSAAIPLLITLLSKK